MPSGLPLERDARLVVEEERLRALPPFKFELLAFNHNGHAEGVIVEEDRRHPIEINFDAVFPFHRPTLRSESDDVKALRHVNRAGEICTLRTQPNDWDPESLTAADVVDLAWKLIVNRGEIEAEEDDAVPEPVDFDSEDGRHTVLLAHEDARAKTSTYGMASLASADFGLRRVLLKELRSPEGVIDWRLPDDAVHQYLLASPNSAGERVPWFRATEPPPYSLDSLEDLERLMPAGLNLKTLLARADPDNRIKRKTQGSIHVLVNYNDESGCRWAFIEAPVHRSQSHRLTPAGAPRYLKPFTIGHDAFFGRIDGMLDRERLQNAHVVLIGAGAIGSRVAAFLNQSGVGRITAFDGDAVTPGNPVRGHLPFAHTGYTKINSVDLTLRTHLPTTRFSGVPYSTLHPEGRQKLEHVLREEQVDLCVVAIGNHNDSRYLDRLLAACHVPRIYTWTSRGAAAGVVLTLSPNGSETDLKNYDEYHQHEVDGDLPELPEESEARVPNVPERGCAAPALPGTPIDIATIALEASQTALDVLLDKPVASYKYWTRGEKAWSSVSLGDSTVPLHETERRRDWLVDEVLLSPSAIRAMKRNAETSPDRETGGILAGYLEGAALRIEYASGPGERSRRTRNRLILDHRYAQGCIDAVATMTDDRLRYTGEWHTHPSGDLTPSSMDRDSLHKLATSAEAGIDAPVIVIASLDREGGFETRAFILCGNTIHEIQIKVAEAISR